MSPLKSPPKLKLVKGAKPHHPPRKRLTMRVDPQERLWVRDAARSQQTVMLWLTLGVWAMSTGSPTMALHLLPCVLLFPLLGVIDARTMHLPDVLTYPLLALGILVSPFGSLFDNLIAAFVGGGIFFLTATVFKAITKRDGLGMGDVKLMAALGPWVGLLGFIPMLLVACAAGLIYNYITRTPRHARLPFGPFLLIGAWLAMFYQGWFWHFLLPPPALSF